MSTESQQATMQAIQINQYGDASVLELTNAPVPALESNDVLIKVHAAALNPVDWKIREGYLAGMLEHKLPLTLGWDVAGEISAIGEGVTDWSVGDAVYSRPNIARDGSYAEYIAIDASEIALKPSSLDWNHAAAVPLAALTAWQSLYDFADVKAGERVLIQAGAGGVGSFAIQLAKLRGAHVISTCSSKNVDFLKSLGADEVIDYTQQDVGELKDLDVVFDTLGGDALASSWQTLKADGRLVSIVDVPDEETAKTHGVNAGFVFVQPNQVQLKVLADLIDDGKVSVTVDSVFPLKDAAAAQAKSETGRAKGKIVLQVI